MLWFETAPNQWEPKCRMPLFMLKPLIATLTEPAGNGDKFRRTDPSGPELELTVTRQQIGGQPGVVLTWPKR
jgi:hypothetical protein